MANRLFVTDGFWDRVDQAIEESGMTKVELAKKMGIERKALYRPTDGSDDRSWHSGRVATFCKITGVSADWLLGLSNRKSLKITKGEPVQFKVIDKKTGKEPIFDFNHLFKMKWFKQSNLIWCDISCWAIDEDGNLMLVDDCDNIAYAPQDRFEVVIL